MKIQVIPQECKGEYIILVYDGIHVNPKRQDIRNAKDSHDALACAMRLSPRMFGIDRLEFYSANRVGAEKVTIAANEPDTCPVCGLSPGIQQDVTGLKPFDIRSCLECGSCVRR